MQRGLVRNAAGKAFQAWRALLAALLRLELDKLLQAAKTEEEKRWLMERAVPRIPTTRMKALSQMLEEVGHAGISPWTDKALLLHEYQYNGPDPDLAVSMYRSRAEAASMPAVYRVGNKAIGWLIRLIFGADISDPLTGMYVARTEVLREAALEAKGFELEVDILAKALSMGARIAEVTIAYRRRVGRKKLRPWHGVLIALKAVSLAYRLNPALALTMLGVLAVIPGVVLGGWVAYRYFYEGIPHYMLGLASLMMLMIGGVSAALLPLYGALQRLQAAVYRTRLAQPPADCLPPPPRADGEVW
ncbi:MAG: PaREP1 family protein [Desulfurococcaceae archaeon]